MRRCDYDIDRPHWSVAADLHSLTGRSGRHIGGSGDAELEEMRTALFYVVTAGTGPASEALTEGRCPSGDRCCRPDLVHQR